MRRAKQLRFEIFKTVTGVGLGFGGSQMRGNPKEKRPFSPKHQIHLIFKSSRARGVNSFLHPRNVQRLDQIVREVARRCGVEIKDYVNVGNHLHLRIKTSHRSLMIRFLRALSGRIPRVVMNCEKGRPLGFKFWDSRPYTKIVAHGLKHFKILQRYFDKNLNQAQKRVEGFDFYREADSFFASG